MPKLKKPSAKEWQEYLEKGDDPDKGSDVIPWQACYQKVETGRLLCFPSNEDTCE